MTRDEIIKALEYTVEKHKHDIVGTGETNIVALAEDCLKHIKRTAERSSIARPYWQTPLHCWVCSKCHHELEEKYKYCGHCGTRWRK